MTCHWSTDRLHIMAVCRGRTYNAICPCIGIAIPQWAHCSLGLWIDQPANVIRPFPIADNGPRIRIHDGHIVYIVAERAAGYQDCLSIYALCWDQINTIEVFDDAPGRYIINIRPRRSITVFLPAGPEDLPAIGGYP